MKTRFMHHILRNIAMLLLAIPVVIGLAGCESIYDDELEPCPMGLKIRFVYDYNLDMANAFPSQVDCLTLHVYDGDGKLLHTWTETSDILSDENYRMTLDLPEGDYRLIAYGGAECDKASFAHVNAPAEGDHYSAINMKLNDECLGDNKELRDLHDHFYGALDVHVYDSTDYTPCTVKMMKNTNHFRILLQHMNYEPLDGNDYEFSIVDDNTLFNHENKLIDNGLIAYRPWYVGSVGTGVKPEVTSSRAITEVTMAVADLSTSRLVCENGALANPSAVTGNGRSPKLIVKYKPTGEEIINIPLNNYLLALQSEHFKKFAPQEFLDRKSQWDLLFFLDKRNHWYKAYIKVDDWEVRVNNINQ